MISLIEVIVPSDSSINIIGLYFPRLLATFKSSPSTSIDANTKFSLSTSNLDSSITSSKVFSIEIKLLKHALKKGKEDPFMYSLEETRKLEAKLKQLTDWYNSVRIQQKNGFGQYIDQPKPTKP